MNVSRPQPEPDEDAVADLMTHLLPGSTGVVALAGGLQARAYAADAGGDRFVLRIGRRRDGFDKDGYAAEHFASPALPIPQVLAIGEFGAHTYCLSRRLPGTPVNQLALDELIPVVEAVDAALRTVWAQDLGDSRGFGLFDRTGDGAYASWHDYLLDPSAVQVAVDQRRIPMGLVEGLHRYVADRADDCPVERWLLHGDFGSDNMLTDGGTITGVLDWELAGYGDWLHDVAEILQWDDAEPCMSAQATHLRRTLPNDADTRLRINCYRARLCLTELAWGSEATLDWMVDTATSIVD